MILISHRGNIDGKKINFENHPSYLLAALESGYEIEFDIWFHKKQWYLGHDEPKFLIKESFLDFVKNKSWIHAKNGEALFRLLKNEKLNVFWHNTDDFTLTSKGYIWTYPKKQLYKNSICVLPEMGFFGKIKKCYGVCSDNFKIVKKLIN